MAASIWQCEERRRVGQGERRKKGSRSDEGAEPCGSASVSNGLALCIDIVLVAFLATLLAAILTAAKLIDILLIDIVLVTSYCTTSCRCSCHSESCANHVTKLAIILAASYSLSSSLCPTRYRPRRVLLAIILAASYSLSSSPPAPSLTSYSSLRIVQLPAVCHSGAALTMSQSSPFYSSRLSRHHTRRVLLAIILAAGVLIAILSRRAHRVVLIASCCVCQLSFVSDTQSNATHIKTALLHVMIAAMGVTLGACAGCLRWKREVW